MKVMGEDFSDPLLPLMGEVDTPHSLKPGAIQTSLNLPKATFH